MRRLAAIVLLTATVGCGPDPRVAELEQQVAAVTAERNASVEKLKAAEARIERGGRRLAECDRARQDAAAEVERLRAAFEPAQRLAIGRFILLRTRQDFDQAILVASNDPAMETLARRVGSGELHFRDWMELRELIVRWMGVALVERLAPPDMQLRLDRTGLEEIDEQIEIVTGIPFDSDRESLIAYRDADFDGKALWRFEHDTEDLKDSELLMVTPTEALEAAR